MLLFLNFVAVSCIWLKFKEGKEEMEKYIKKFDEMQKYFMKVCYLTPS